MMKSLILAALLLGGTTASSWALNAQEAEAVVTILEVLSPARGEGVYMGEDVAGDWFEFDSDGAGLIVAAGFSARSWAQAYDETLMGYAAGIDEAEITRQIAVAEESVAASALGAAEKEEFLAEFRADMAEVMQARQEGQAYAAMVAPHWERLHLLVQGE